MLFQVYHLTFVIVHGVIFQLLPLFTFRVKLLCFDYVENPENLTVSFHRYAV